MLCISFLLWRHHKTKTKNESNICVVQSRSHLHVNGNMFMYICRELRWRKCNYCPYYPSDAVILDLVIANIILSAYFSDRKQKQVKVIKVHTHRSSLLWRVEFRGQPKNAVIELHRECRLIIYINLIYSVGRSWSLGYVL